VPKIEEVKLSQEGFTFSLLLVGSTDIIYTSLTFVWLVDFLQFLHPGNLVVAVLDGEAVLRPVDYGVICAIDTWLPYAGSCYHCSDRILDVDVRATHCDEIAYVAEDDLHGRSQPLNLENRSTTP